MRSERPPLPSKGPGALRMLGPSLRESLSLVCQQLRPQADLPGFAVTKQAPVGQWLDGDIDTRTTGQTPTSKRQATPRDWAWCLALRNKCDQSSDLQLTLTCPQIQAPASLSRQLQGLACAFKLRFSASPVQAATKTTALLTGTMWRACFWCRRSTLEPFITLVLGTEEMPTSGDRRRHVQIPV